MRKKIVINAWDLVKNKKQSLKICILEEFYEIDNNEYKKKNNTKNQL